MAEQWVVHLADLTVALKAGRSVVKTVAKWAEPTEVLLAARTEVRLAGL